MKTYLNGNIKADQRKLGAKAARLIELRASFKAATTKASQNSFKGKMTRCERDIAALRVRIERLSKRIDSSNRHSIFQVGARAGGIAKLLKAQQFKMADSYTISLMIKLNPDHLLPIGDLMKKVREMVADRDYVGVERLSQEIIDLSTTTPPT